jgi:simple sugar transport system permease protein
VGGVVNIGEAYYAMLIGAFGDPTKVVIAIGSGNPSEIATAIRPLTETLVAATPLIFCGLAVAVAFRSGVFNIGVEGQFIMGAMGATVAVLVLEGLPVVVHLPLVILFGTLTGAAWGFIPGFLKARTGAHEVITTIMLNLIALQLVSFGLREDFIRQAGSSAPISKVLSGIVQVPPIFDLPAIRLHYGFVVALIMAAIVSFFLFKTTKGFELRAAGFNLTAARYAGMSAGGSIMLAMTLSGGIAGLGGSFEVVGLIGQMSAGVSANYGFSAIALALLAGNRPAGIVAAALLFGALRNGGGLMQVQTGIPLDLLLFIQALVIMFVAAPLLVRSIFRMKARPLDEGSPI